MSNFKTLIAELEILITDSYESGVTLTEAEALASRFLAAQLRVSEELRKADLDARMRKTGVKAARAATYLAEVQKTEKKPSDSLLGALVDSDEQVQTIQNDYDSAEVEKAELERIFSVLQNAHVHFRQVSKGRFEG
jgi:hypothetical protein